MSNTTLTHDQQELLAKLQAEAKEKGITLSRALLNYSDNPLVHGNSYGKKYVDYEAVSDYCFKNNMLNGGI